MLISIYEVIRKQNVTVYNPNIVIGKLLL